MNRIEDYLYRILRRSGLTRSEQSEWVAEMSTHLEDEMKHLRESGCSEEEAFQKALDHFGSPRDIRRQVARQTFGVTLPVITLFASLFFALFLVGIYLVYASVATNPDPSTWPSWHENPWVHFFTARVPLSPSLMLALSLDVIMLLKTRRARDRWALASITGIYCALWLFLRISHNYDLAWLVVSAWNYVSLPWVALTGYLLLFCWSISLYIFTKNPSISRFPIVLSLALGLWVPIKNAVQFHLWKATHWSALWGHYDPFTYDGFRIFIAVAIRLLLLVFAFYAFRGINRLSPEKRPTTSN